MVMTSSAPAAFPVITGRSGRERIYDGCPDLP
jgi:hypothetical protein